MISSNSPSNPHVDHIYTSFTNKLFPGLDSLRKKEILPLKNLFDLTGDTYHPSYKEALRLTRVYITNISQNSDNPRPKLAIIPAGKMFKELIRHQEIFDGIELIGGFDGSLTKPSSNSNIPIYPTNQLDSTAVDHILLLTDNFAKEIFDQLASLIDLEKTAVYCPFWDPVTAETQVSKEITAINTICREHQGAPVILVTCIRFFSFLYKRLKALREANAKVILVTLLDDVSHTVDVHEMEDACDYIYSANGHMLNYLQVLAKTTPDIVHIFANAGSSSIPVIASSVCQESYIIEYNDILTNTHDKNTLAKAIGSEKATIEFKSEQYLIQHSNGLIYNNHKSAIDHLFNFHGTSSPILEFSYYPLNKVSNKKPTNKTDQEISLVFIGGIHHSQYENYWNNSIIQQTFKMVDILTEQNFTVDIYNAYDSGKTNDFTEFHDKAMQNPDFRYHQAVHPKKLSKVLLQYDAGLFVHDYKNSQIKNDVLDRTMSSRFFEYLEAGLPIIMSPELRFMAGILEKNSLGISIEYDQIQNLSKLLSPQKLACLQDNVKTYVNNMIMTKHIPRLISFYNRSSNSITLKQPDH